MASPSSEIRLGSPYTGRAVPLDGVADPVFAGRLVGDGLAVEPTIGEMRAPCDGVVASPHPAGHALTVVSDDGVEVLMHVGVETVGLDGAGFAVLVKEGERVRAGQSLVRFDLAFLAARVPATTSMMIVANGDAFRVTAVETGHDVVFGAPVLTVATAKTVAVDDDGGEPVTIILPLKIAHGLHARPAAILAEAARRHPGRVALTCREKTVDAKSVVGVMGLDARFGDLLTFRIEGAGAEATGDALLDLVISGLGDPIAEAPAAAAAPSALPPLGQAERPLGLAPFPDGVEVVLQGRSAVAGLASGFVLRRRPEVVDPPNRGAGPAVERGRLATARSRAIAALAAAPDDPTRAAIFAAHRALIDDPELDAAAEAEIAGGASAEWAWTAACGHQAAIFAGLPDPRMAERAADMRDVAARVVSLLTGRTAGALAALPSGSVVLADEILPSEFTGLEVGHLAALLMRDGGPTSHAAILAAGLGIPTVVALGSDADRVADGAEVLVDAGLGRVTVHPERETAAAFARRTKDRAERTARGRLRAHEDCRMLDGTRVEVFANLGRLGEGTRAVAEGAEGCGLLRSEFLFLDRTSAPDEEEQLACCQAIADELGGRPLVIRTLDVGGDKPLSYLPLPAEANPFLGLRGVRVGLRETGLLRTQIRAILRVKPFGVVSLMVPMVSSCEEMRAVRALVEEERRALGRAEPIAVGAMIEIPAAAVAARRLAEVCDFFSIGTNDLAQYALAMDRGNPAVAAGVDALHPGVLGLVRLTVEGAAPTGRGVAVCGGAASDPLAAPILVGSGVRELSVAPAAVAEIKSLLSGLTLDRCRRLAEAALAAEGPAEVRAIAAALLDGD